MFIAERLAFVELHKTGGTHILRLLQELVGGCQVGKHNRLPPDYRDRLVIGSVRNPWDWYVSLWAYGCGGEGSVRRRVSRRLDLDYYYRQLPKEMGKNWLAPREWIIQAVHDLRKPAAVWRAAYGNSDDPALFRQWLRLLFDPHRAFDPGEGYGFSPACRRWGLMTYRYLKLFTSLESARLYRDTSLTTEDGIRRALENDLLVQRFVHNETLEEDLLAAVEQAGYQIAEEQRLRLLGGEGGRTNRSARRPATYYYDDETAALVAAREKLIIERHGYSAPV